MAVKKDDERHFTVDDRRYELRDAGDDANPAQRWELVSRRGTVIGRYAAQADARRDVENPDSYARNVERREG